MAQRPSYSGVRIIFFVTAAFILGVSLITYILLTLKGLPSFAATHHWDVMTWVFHATWAAALAAGFLVSMIVWILTNNTDFFTVPYDFGRCFSLGAILGACTEAFSTWMYGHLCHRPFSNFWIAGATMSGCLVGSVATAIVLARSKKLPT